MKKNAIENSFLEKSNIYIEIDRTEEGIIFQHPLRISIEPYIYILNVLEFQYLLILTGHKYPKIVV